MDGQTACLILTKIWEWIAIYPGGNIGGLKFTPHLSKWSPPREVDLPDETFGRPLLSNISGATYRLANKYYKTLGEEIDRNVYYVDHVLGGEGTGRGRDGDGSGGRLRGPRATPGPPASIVYIPLLIFTGMMGSPNAQAAGLELSKPLRLSDK